MPIPVAPEAVARSRADACPGALSVHVAADGGLARVRLPGGVVSGAAVLALAAAAADLGRGDLELTSRANVQVRGLATGAELELGLRIAAVGLLPSASHERVRNLVASPLSGIDDAGVVDVSPLAPELDRQLCARPVLADLPGRFLFGLDDGRGDLGRLSPDLTAVARAVDRFEIHPGGFTVDRSQVVPVLLAAAEAFLSERESLRSGAASAEAAGGTSGGGAASGGASGEWRISELPDAGQGLLQRVARQFRGAPASGSAGEHSLPAPPPEPVGVIEQADGRAALVVLAPLGRLTVEQASFLARHAGVRGLRITPWRSVVLPDLIEVTSVAKQASALGLGIDEQSPWYRVSACTGRPGCAKALADVRADALSEVFNHGAPPHTVRWSGCERRCGRPHDVQIDLIATGNGYRRTENGTT
ncbi:MAG: precorrin-3B synthase [Pseudonocardiales bacterium]|nr:precorrin-3B synthase [Pseudonocardiales bacterium]